MSGLGRRHANTLSRYVGFGLVEKGWRWRNNLAVESIHFYHWCLKLQWSFNRSYTSYGTAISDGSGKSHKASAAAWQKCTKAKLFNGCHATFCCHATLLVAYLGDFLSFVQFGDFGLMENFLRIIYAFSQEYCFWASPGKSWVYYPSSTFREISLSTLRSFLCLGGCATHKEDRGLFMRPWDILEKSILVLTQKQSKLKKVNKFWWATGVGLFPLYTKVIMWHI